MAGGLTRNELFCAEDKLPRLDFEFVRMPELVRSAHRFIVIRESE
jgi:hypothetical protein